MLRVMLCGASDIEDVSKQFDEVTMQYGGDPWHYLDGRIFYRNTSTASWDHNSRKTVASADVCVFVVVRRIGRLTWGTELRAALDNGKPFIILCLATTYNSYLSLRRTVSPDAIGEEDQRGIVALLSELEDDRQLTVVPFDMGHFGDIYLREAAKLFAAGLEALEVRTRREALAARLGSTDNLTKHDLVAAEELALDEFEDKNVRKQAVLTLANHRAASPETVASLLLSREQGVQRVAISHLPSLYVQRPPDPDFLSECVTVANQADDVGIARRLIPALFELDVPAAVDALSTLDLTEVGARRRLAAELERNETELSDASARESALRLLGRCLEESEDVGWVARGKAFMHRLRNSPSPDS